MVSLLSTVGGLALISIYLYLQSRYPEETLVQFLPRIVGRVAGKLLGLAYIVYFLYLGARAVRDYGELTVTVLLPSTPIGAINGLGVLLVVYCLRHGREVLARVSEVLLPLGVLPLLSVVLLVLPRIRAENLLPVLGNGPGPVLAASFPLGVTVPFGETVVFLMLWSNEGKERARGAVRAIIIAGLMLTYLNLLGAAVLGSHLARTSPFPLLEVVRQISVAEVVDRIDVMAALVMTLGGFTRVAVYLYGATVGLAQWLGVADYRPLVLPVATIVMALTITIAQSYPEHVLVGLRLVPSLLHVPFQIAIPSLLLLVVLIKRWAGK